MNKDDADQLIQAAKRQGRRLLVVEYQKNSYILTTEDPKVIADQIGEAIAMAVKLFHTGALKDGLLLTEKDVFDAVIYACFRRADKILNPKNNLKAESA